MFWEQNQTGKMSTKGIVYMELAVTKMAELTSAEMLKTLGDCGWWEIPDAKEYKPNK